MDALTILRPTGADVALLDLLGLLQKSGYRFITPTPATHARVIGRPDRRVARTVEDVLGWSLPFEPQTLSRDVLRCLAEANMLATHPLGHRSRIRVSSLGENLYIHSAFPTTAKDAVFFGPDSYRFADMIARELTYKLPLDGAQIVDIGTGAGVGAIVAAGICPKARLTITDVNTNALRFAKLNAAVAGVETEAVETAGLENVKGAIDVALINPPYIIDGEARAYRDGGGMHGAELSLSLTEAAVTRLSTGGRVLLYTGSAIIGGRDFLRDALDRRVAIAGCTLRYSELDPDVFGEELEKPVYENVDRIALVSAVIEHRPHG